MFSNQKRANVYSTTYSANVCPSFERGASLDEQQDPEDGEARERLVEERRLERRVLRVADGPVCGAISSPHGSVVGFPNSSWLK